MNLRKDHYRGEAPAALLPRVNYRAIDTELTGWLLPFGRLRTFGGGEDGRRSA